MAVLVGIYLLDCESTQVEQDGQPVWIGNWTLLRSASRDRVHWEPLTSGQAAQSFTTREEALEAGQHEGAAFARMLQADDWLEPMVYAASSSQAAATGQACTKRSA
jgi:hypothetical protein